MSDFKIISIDKENMRGIKVLDTLNPKKREKIASYFKSLSVVRRKFNVEWLDYYEDVSEDRFVSAYLEYFAFDLDDPNERTFRANNIPRDFLIRDFRAIKNYIYYLYSEIISEEGDWEITGTKFETYFNSTFNDVRESRIIENHESISLLNEIDIFLRSLLANFSENEPIVFSFCFIYRYDDASNYSSEELFTPPKPTYLTRKCSVCYNDKSCVLFSECGHIPICVACDRTSKCPICRKTSNKRFKIEFEEGN